MSIVMFALTSTSDDEIRWALSTLKNSSAGTGFLHESFNKDDVTQYTRPWFAWINGLFGELIMKIADERPYLIFNS
jgi:meiotically up-regulated gene 157 (Mug157) protein